MDDKNLVPPGNPNAPTPCCDSDAEEREYYSAWTALGVGFLLFWACLVLGSMLGGCATSTGEIVTMEQDGFKWRNTSLFSKQLVDQRGKFDMTKDAVSFSASGNADQDSTAMTLVIDHAIQAAIKAALSGALGAPPLPSSGTPSPSAPSLFDRLDGIEDFLREHGMTKLRPVTP